MVDNPKNWVPCSELRLVIQQPHMLTHTLRTANLGAHYEKPVYGRGVAAGELKSGDLLDPQALQHLLNLGKIKFRENTPVQIDAFCRQHRLS